MNTLINVPSRGLEPLRAKAHYVLNVARLPIPPRGRARTIITKE